MSARMILCLVAVCALAVSACQQDGSTEDALNDVKKTAGDLTESAENMASTVSNFSQDKIEEIGRIAAMLEKAPAEAKKMLDEHGWSKEDFDKMVSAIRDNESLNKIFEAAKAKALQG